MLKRNIVANYAGTAWNAAMSLAFVPLYIKYLGPESYGLVGASAMLNAYMAFFTVGLSPMVGREVARFRGGIHSAQAIRSLLRVVELVFICIGVLCVSGLWLSAPWIAGNWLNPESMSDSSVAHAIRILSAVIGLRFLEGLYSSALGGLQRQVTVNVVSSSTATLRAAGSIAVLIWWSPTIDAFFWWQGVVALLGTITLWICAYAYLPKAPVSLKVGIECLRDGWPFARGMLLGSFLTLAATQTDKLLLTRLLDLSDYGRYSLAVGVAASLALLTVPIHTAFYPRFTELLAAGRRSDAAREFHRAAQLVSVVTGSIGIVLIVFADRMLLLWTGNAGLTDEVAGPLRLLLLGYLLNAIGAMPYALQLATGRTGLSNWIAVVSVSVSVPTLMYVVPRMGTAGAGLVWLCLNGAIVAVFVPVLARQTSLFTTRAWLLGDVAGPACAAAVTCGLVLLVSFTLPISAGASAVVVGAALMTSACGAIAAAPSVRIAATNFLRSRLAGRQH
jgi:O-antigen/teichoic acid export membrane protein